MKITIPNCLQSLFRPNVTFIFGLFLIVLGNNLSLAQGPGSLFVDAGPDITIDCNTGSGCADITATFLATFESATNQYSISSIDYNPPFPFNGLANQLNPNEDDRWSIVETLPFDFCFFENIETEFQVGSNGVIRFDVDPGDISNGWSFTENLPNNSNPTLGEANVFTPCHDIDPSASSTEEIGYEVLGTFPNRVLVVSYYEVPMFSGTCNNLLATQMVVFYEFSNVVEIYMQDKPVCPTWNSGNATLGIQNNDGNIAYVPPGRNTSDSPWTATNEAWQISPAGDPSYVFEWLDSGGNVISINPTVEVCPNGTEIYTARVTYTNCNGDVVILTDDVEVSSTASFTMDLGGDQVFCDTPSYDITAELDGVDPMDATFLWNTGETTQTITVTTTGIYSCEVTADGCSITQEVSITFLTAPDCEILSSCGGIDFLEDFGTGTGRVCDLNGATTTYVCNTVSQVNDGEYTVTNTSTGLNTGWHVGMEDHTEGDVNGRMYFVNADDVTSGEFYRRTITLNSNTDYSFNAWITTVYDTDTNICPGGGIPANVKFRIEDLGGNTISETDTGDIPNGPNPVWQEYTIFFNTGANTDVQLVLFNNGIGGCGNDLVIDDISLSYQNPEPQIETPEDLNACDETGNGEATFDLTTQIPTILNGQDPALFNISFHHTLLEAQANTNPIATPNAYVNVANPETVYVRAEKVDDPTCFATVEFDLIVGLNEDFQIVLPVSTIICEGDDLPTFDATPQNPSIDLNQVTYEWQDGGGNIVGTAATYTPTAAGIYTVTVTYPPCSQDTYTTELIINTPPTLDLGEDQIICDGSEFEIIPVIEGDTTGITYLWSNGETTPTIIVTASGDYTLEITVGPCVVSDLISISIAENPIIDLGADFSSCFVEEALLDATPSNYNAEDGTYEWFQDGVLLAGETGPTLLVGQEGTYSVIVTVGNCTAEDSIVLSIGNDIAVSLGEDFESCFDQNVVLEALATNYDPELASYEWYQDGTLLPGETAATLIVVEEGSYTVMVTYGSCTAEDTIAVTARGELVVTVDEDFKTCPEETQVLTAVTNETDVTFQWYLNGDVLVGETGQTLEFTVPENTVGEQIYSVVISVGDCTGTDAVAVTLYDVGRCIIPQGLSPNGDGLNDCLDLEFLADRSGAFSVEFFNRYGMSVFEQNNYVNEFCGVDSDGNELPTGTYFYVIKFSTADPMYGEVKTGWIYINRENN